MTLDDIDRWTTAGTRHEMRAAFAAMARYPNGQVEIEAPSPGAFFDTLGRLCEGLTVCDGAMMMPSLCVACDLPGGATYAQGAAAVSTLPSAYRERVTSAVDRRNAELAYERSRPWRQP